MLGTRYPSRGQAPEIPAMRLNGFHADGFTNLMWDFTTVDFAHIRLKNRGAIYTGNLLGKFWLTSIYG
ncbi:hypothetical protein GZ77_00565 [Endozoicomonas montiporae]|uniref:Uncharacterized protein n=1 Tax=Endozoicomonas montiporae TaxID=1027273 RepID=A0A081N9U5_9GAMM|nr:hypothetical protein GZ77_00565 [Endozoicomonas montiporae]